MKIGSIVRYQGMTAIIAAQALDQDCNPAWYIQLHKDANRGNWPYQGKVVSKIAHEEELEEE